MATTPLELELEQGTTRRTRVILVLHLMRYANEDFILESPVPNSKRVLLAAWPDGVSCFIN